MRREVNTIFDDRYNAYFGESMSISRQDMESRVWRFNELKPSPAAFLDCILPGHFRTLYSALGQGTEDENLEGTAVEEAENYHIDFVKAAPNNGAALHSHGAEETFIALTGRWDVFWGDDGTDKIILEPNDGIVVPAGVLRGFRNIFNEESVLLAVLGARNLGHCVWGKSLREKLAKEHFQTKPT